MQQEDAPQQSVCDEDCICARRPMRQRSTCKVHSQDLRLCPEEDSTLSLHVYLIRSFLMSLITNSVIVFKYLCRDVGFETRRGTDIPIVLVVLETQEPQSCYGIDKILVKRRKWCGVEKTECWQTRGIYTPRLRTSSFLSHYLGDAARQTHGE